jgi:DNA-binding HxlR family transcriptional regulator
MATKRYCPDLCPKFQLAMAVLAKPWNGLIIASLYDNQLRFSELVLRLGGIGDRMLSARLKELAARGLIERKVLEGPPVRVEYQLTEVGRGFHAVAAAIGQWGKTLSDEMPKAPRRRSRAA